MSRERKVLLGVAAVIAVAFLGWLILFRVSVSEKEADQLIRTRLPIGTDKTEVLRFLESRGWEHGGVKTPSDTEKTFDHDDIAYGADKFIRGRILNVGLGWPGLGYLEIGFAFDRQGKLTRYQVQQIGPDTL